MPLELRHFQDPALDADYVTWLLDQKAPDMEARFQRFWNYYRNPQLPATDASAGTFNENSRPYVLAQEWGLPSRITGFQRGNQPLTDLRRKEVVIENDIAWRINAQVDYLFGQGVTLCSAASDSNLAEVISRVLNAFFESNGGAAFFQEAAMLASVYGYVDLILRIPSDWPASLASALASEADSVDSAILGPGGDLNRRGSFINGQKRSDADDGGTRGDRSKSNSFLPESMARRLRIETVDAPRVLPILAEEDYHCCRYWIQRYFRHPSRMASPQRNWMGRIRRQPLSPDVVEVVDILSPTFWQRYEDRRLTAQGPNVLGYLPVVHIQNITSSGNYGGLSDVEPLIPLQDELNTRLSDRAHRVTYQSFKMYLGKGIDDFLDRPVGPGQMWATQNLNASIESFGAEEGSPSENIHIEQVRRAMDKTSGVSPVAAGLLEDKLGNLSSATALKVVLSGLLNKTARKQRLFAEGIRQLSGMVLDVLHRGGILKTAIEDRHIEVHWPDPLPGSRTEALHNAQIKQSLGVPQNRLLAELGYDTEALNTQD